MTTKANPTAAEYRASRINKRKSLNAGTLMKYLEERLDVATKEWQAYMKLPVSEMTNYWNGVRRGTMDVMWWVQYEARLIDVNKRKQEVLDEMARLAEELGEYDSATN